MSGNRAQCCVQRFSMNRARRRTIADDDPVCRTGALDSELSTLDWSVVFGLGEHSQPRYSGL